LKVIFIRHPKPVIEPGVCYGQLDIPADAIDMQRVLEKLSVLQKPIACASSPLIRAHHLAIGMQQQGWPEPIIHNDLMEMNFGDWENRAWRDIPREQIDGWAANTLHFTAPNGESVQQLGNRSAAAVRELIRQVKQRQQPSEDDYLAVFCHAGVLQTAPTLLKGGALNPQDDLKLKFDYGDTVEVFVINS
jgi:alpha-ribazole phosphatase